MEAGKAGGPRVAELPEVGGVWNLNQTVRRFSRARTHAAAAALRREHERKRPHQAL